MRSHTNHFLDLVDLMETPGAGEINHRLAFLKTLRPFGPLLQMILITQAACLFGVYRQRADQLDAILIAQDVAQTLLAPPDTQRPLASGQRFGREPWYVGHQPAREQRIAHRTARRQLQTHTLNITRCHADGHLDRDRGNVGCQCLVHDRLSVGHKPARRA